jgi:hypothetical protein
MGVCAAEKPFQISARVEAGSQKMPLLLMRWRSHFDHYGSRDRVLTGEGGQIIAAQS